MIAYRLYDFIPGVGTSIVKYEEVLDQEKFLVD